MKNFWGVIIILFFSCSSSDNMILVTNSGEAQGTYYHIKYMSNNGNNYKLQIDSIFLEVDNSLSIYKENSLISRLNNGDDLKTDYYFSQVFNAANKVSQETQGNFDCSVRSLLDAWGFYKHNLGDSLVVDSSKFRRLLQDVGYKKIVLIEDSLILPKGMSLDFNSIAQGYTVDVIGSFLESKGSNNYLVEVGGEVLAKGKNSDGDIWRIGVDKPTDSIDSKERFFFILDLENKALATSGNYRKFYKKDGVKYSHTINPFTGFPAKNNLLSATVMHNECMFADAYATAFMVMGLKKSKQFALENPEIEIYLVYTGNDGAWGTYISPGMRKRIIN